MTSSRLGAASCGVFAVVVLLAIGAAALCYRAGLGVSPAQASDPMRWVAGGLIYTITGGPLSLLGLAWGRAAVSRSNPPATTAQAGVVLNGFAVFALLLGLVTFFVMVGIRMMS